VPTAPELKPAHNQLIRRMGSAKARSETHRTGL
jgi:hypothetical protein